MTVTSDPVALNDWYVVTFEDEIAPGATQTTRLLGQDILVVRDLEREFHCFLVEEDGSKTPVPQLKRRYGFVWITLGAPTHDIIDIPQFKEEGRTFFHRGRIVVPSSGQRVIENFFDLAHFSFVHTGTLGGYESAEVQRYSVQLREEGRELWAVGCSFYQPKPSVAASTSATIYTDYRIPSPFITILYKDSLIKPGQKDLIGLFVQPHDEEHCTVQSFALLFDTGNSITHLLHFYHEIFMQDRAILIQQMPKKLPVHARREIPTISDASSVAYRRWLDRSGLEFGLDRTAE